MGAIYSAAEVTIIAAAGADPSHGLPGISHARRRQDLEERAGAGYLRLKLEFSRERIAGTIWASRA